MQRCVPDRKWRKVLRAVEEKEEPSDPQLAQVYGVIQETVQDEVIEYALTLIADPTVRDRLVAYFLSGALVREIHESLWIPMEVLEVFQDLFINKQEFRHKLEIHQYAEKYIKEVGEEGCEEWIKLGVEVGPAALIFKHVHGHEELPVDARAITREVIQQSFNLGRLARANSINSAASKEAYKWLGAAARIASSYDKAGNDDGSEDEAIAAIERVKMTRTPEEADVPLDKILH